jgi:hypothetical protein
VDIVMTKHALDRIAEHGLDRAWVESIALAPEWVEDDPRPGVRLHFGVLPERAGRVLRVAVTDRGGDRLVLSAHLDRGARRP